MVYIIPTSDMGNTLNTVKSYIKPDSDVPLTGVKVDKNEDSNQTYEHQIRKYNGIGTYDQAVKESFQEYYYNGGMTEKIATEVVTVLSERQSEDYTPMTVFDSLSSSTSSYEDNLATQNSSSSSSSFQRNNSIHHSLRRTHDNHHGTNRKSDLISLRLDISDISDVSCEHTYQGH